MAEDSALSGQDGGLSKLDCFIRFDEVNYWLSRTRDLITNAETYSYPAFRESFRELRREAQEIRDGIGDCAFQVRKTNGEKG